MLPNRSSALVVTLFLLLGASHCNTQSVAGLSGTIHLTSPWKAQLYLIQPRNFGEIASSFSGLVLDSARIDASGHFEFDRLPMGADTQLIQLCIQKTGNRFPNQLLDEDPALANYMPLICVKGQSIQIEAEADHFQASMVIQNPSPENRALLQLRELRQHLFQQEQAAFSPTAEEANLLAREDALLRFQQPLMAFADSSAYLLPALVAARWVSPKSDYERVPEFLVHLCEKWRSRYPQNNWTQQLCQLGNRESMPLLSGDMMPDYPLPMSGGDTVMLRSLLGKRVTIVDIWASWCMPCRHENRDVLAPLWAQYRNDGMQIIGYSIDSSPAAWKTAIAKDGADWPHASHLSGDETPFLKTLRITTIPANFILDDKGVVIAKNLHGEALRAFLKDYLK